MFSLGQLYSGKIVLLTLVLARVSGLTVTAPIYGGSQVPMQIRGLLAFTISLLILPTQWHVAVRDPGSLLNCLVFVGGELLIGLCLGQGIQILFYGIQLTGQVLGRVGGQALADVFDPNLQEDTPVLSQMLYFVVLAVFVAIGGHRMVMAGLLDTFRAIPPGGAGLPENIGLAMITLLTQSFALALQAAAPAVTALLLATLIMGLIGRTLPQLNVMVLGFTLNGIILFVVVAVTLAGSIWVFQDSLQAALDLLLERWGRGKCRNRRAKNPKTQPRIAGSRPARKGTSPRAKTLPRRPCW